MKFLFIVEQVPVQVAKYSEFWSLHVNRVHPHVPPVTMPPHSPQIVCKTSVLKFSIAVQFFTCALLKEYKKPTGTRADLMGLDSVGVHPS